jgi:hypothetical protein
MACSDVPLPGEAGSQCHFVLMSALIRFGAFLNAVGSDRERIDGDLVMTY